MEFVLLVLVLLVAVALMLASAPLCAPWNSEGREDHQATSTLTRQWWPEIEKRRRRRSSTRTCKEHTYLRC